MRSRSIYTTMMVRLHRCRLFITEIENRIDRHNICSLVSTHATTQWPHTHPESNVQCACKWMDIFASMENNSSCKNENRTPLNWYHSFWFRPTCIHTWNGECSSRLQCPHCHIECFVSVAWCMACTWIEAGSKHRFFYVARHYHFGRSFYCCCCCRCCCSPFRFTYLISRMNIVLQTRQVHLACSFVLCLSHNRFHMRELT